MSYKIVVEGQVVKEYPFIEQCYALLYRLGYVYTCRYGSFIDDRFTIKKGESE